MILFPNCKINLGLNIIQKRTDGYHDLETVFYPLPMNDVLEIIPSGSFNFILSGLAVAGKAADNLCVKAFQLIKKDFPSLPNIHIHLHKHIPIGAGLGGGSADGSFTLRLINEKFKLNITEKMLIGYALQLGSDCPFFIVNKPCFAGKRGESLTPVTVDLSAYSFMLVHPGIHIATDWAFSKISPVKPAKSIRNIISQPVASWAKDLVNDFEKPVLDKHKPLRDIKTKLYNAGAYYASMTGSGSSFYGIFKKNTIPDAIFDKTFQVTILP